jgi:phosphoribosylamine--glycine ligase
MKERSVGNTVAIIGGGGAEAALVEKYAQSEHVDKIIVIPGNDLMKYVTDKPVQIYPQVKATDKKSIGEICEQQWVDLVDVRQERAIENGTVNLLIEKEIPVVGPTREASRIEWDKAYARQLCFGLPQPDLFIRTRRELNYALNRIDLEPNKPRFVKAAFLADGKGAKPAKNKEEAKKAILEIANTEAGKVFLVEDWLRGDDERPGEEFSLFVAVDGEHYRILGNAQDYKRENNFDEGENTGSMGCASPTSLMTPRLLEDSKKEIIEKVLFRLREKGAPYKGILYLGGMAISKANRTYARYPDEFDLKPYIVEFNARWGDPEAQAILPGLKVDLFELGKAISDGDISKIQIGHDGKVRIAVTGAAKGYPREEEYKWVKGSQIFGLDKIRKLDGIKLYPAAIKEYNGKYYAWGERLFYVVAEGKNIIESRSKAAEAMSLAYIEGNNLKVRNDIGWRDAQRYHNPPRRITASMMVKEIERQLRNEDERIECIIKQQNKDKI